VPSPRIDLNADLGESFGAWAMGDDERVLAHVSSANIACGFHAGDPQVIDRTVELALAAGVAVGAHPSYWDLRGFGRRAIAADPAEVEADVVYQVGAVRAFVESRGARLVHVKPHGALYNQAAVDEALARAVARGVARVAKDLVLVGLASSSAMRRAAGDFGLRFAAEAFADRAYKNDGTLVPRRQAGAVIASPAEAASRAVRIAREGRVTAIDGTDVVLAADTICLHGDSADAAARVLEVREALEAAGVAVRALDR
jgi:5-oxoprolinase (ATP-hydrolysing) subunit A